MAENKITIEIDVEGDASKEIKKLSKNTKAFGKVASAAFSNAGRFFANFAANLASAAVIGGFKALASAAKSLFRIFVTDGIRAAQIQEDAINELNTALELSGQFTNAASQELQNYASELQSVTKFGDETILSTAALIQSLGALETDGLKRATTAAVNLAAALKVDLKAAALLVGKAAAGEISSFSRYGLILKKGETNAETFEIALTALEKKFGGAAEKQVKTFSGSVQQLSNTFGDLTETTGGAVTNNQSIIAVFNELNAIIGEVNGTIKGSEDAFRDFVDASLISMLDTAQKIIKAFKSIQIAMLQLKADFITAQGSISIITDAFTFGLTGARKRAEEGAAEVAKLENQIRKLESGKNIFDDLANSIQRVGVAVKEAAGTTKELTPDREPTGAVEDEKDPNADVQKEADRLLARNALLAQIQNQANRDEIARNEARIREIIKLETIGADKRLAIEVKLANAEKTRNAAKLRATRQFFGGLATLQQSSSKELFAVGKAASLADAIVSGQAAIQNAFEAVPFPFNFLAAAGVAAATAVQISKISATKFEPTGAQAGLTSVPGGFPNDSFPARLTSGERVVSAPQNQDLISFMQQNNDLGDKLDVLIDITMQRKQQVVVNVGTEQIIDVVQDEIDSGRTLQL